jgi:hypothetical protein
LKGFEICSECGGKKFIHVFKLKHVKYETKTKEQKFIQIPDDCYVPDNLIDLIKSTCINSSHLVEKYKVFKFRL